MMGDVSLTDALILLLMGVGLIYFYANNRILTRRIERMREALIDFGPALEAFIEAVDRSEKSLGNLQETTRNLKGKAETDKQKASRETKAASGNDNLVKMFYRLTREGNS